MRSVLPRERTTICVRRSRATWSCDVGRTEPLEGVYDRAAFGLLGVSAACNLAFKAVGYLRPDRRQAVR